jgi:hypothetical protein
LALAVVHLAAALTDLRDRLPHLDGGVCCCDRVRLGAGRCGGEDVLEDVLEDGLGQVDAEPAADARRSPPPMKWLRGADPVMKTLSPPISPGAITPAAPSAQASSAPAMSAAWKADRRADLAVLTPGAETGLSGARRHARPALPGRWR